MTTTLLLSLLFAGAVLSWHSWRELTQLRRELERHEQEQAIKRRVLAEVARWEVQP